MKFLWLNFICVLLITLSRVDRVRSTRDHDNPNVIELVGYNSNPAGGNRRSRMSRYNPSDDSEQQMRQYRQYSSLLVTPSPNKEQADIETVKSNIEEYNKLLKLDTKKLNDQQKDMLERIVERVARLKESYDINAEDQTSESNKPTNATKDEDNSEHKKTTLSTDDTITTIQSTTYVPTTVSTETIVSQARSATDSKSSNSNSNSSNNNKNSSTRNNNTSNKSRVRQHSTKRPSSSTKTTAKRTTAHRQPTKASTASHTISSTIATPSTTVPISSSGSSSSNSRNSNIATTNSSTMNTEHNVGNINVGQQKVIPATTIQPRVKSALSQQSYGQQQDALHDVLIKQQNHHLQHHHYHSASDDLAMEQKTIPNGGYGVQSSLIYDTNVTASSIIDSLANHGRDEYYARPHTEANKEKKTTATMKPTKYHFYPHNQHIYLLPECAIQQVCNAVYVRLNYTQPLCACPSRYRDPCSASLSEDDEHTTKLVGDISKKAITLAKTCESTTEMRECRTPKDWSLLALQNTRTGKSHYLVICRCPAHFKLEGPMAHDQPTYASVPGIRVFGMMCVKPGYSVRKPSVQPPKRYQLQKPYYVPSSNKYGSIKDSRPSYGQQDSSYQNQYQANYQYLSRPDNTPILASNTEYPDSIQLNTFGGVYGRNNERKGETVAAEDETTSAAAAAAATDNTTANSNTNNNSNSSNSSNNNSSNNNNKENSKREKRDVTNDDYAVDDDDVPEFPWHRLEELRRSVLWD